MMKKTKKGFKSLAILLALVLAIGFSPATNVSAKTAPRLNYKKVTIVQGKKKRLKVKGTKRKVKWSSTKKSVVTVNKKGVIKAKKKGKATIIAKVGKKKFRCKVTVKKKPAKKKSSKKSISSERKQLPVNLINKWSYVDQPPLAVGTKVDLFNYLTAFGKKVTITSKTLKIKYFKWDSSNTSRLVVDKYGIAYPKQTGSVKITCKYLTRDNKWHKVVSSVNVIATDKIKVSYTVGLDSDLAVDSHYETYYADDTTNKFNVLNLTVNNNSSEAMVFSNYLAFGLTSTSVSFNFQTVDKKKVTVPAHSTKIIKFVPGYYYDIIDNKCPYNFCLNKRDLESLNFSFKSNGKSVYASYLVESSKLTLH